MRVWLIQRAEPTPHDNAGAQRKLRTGLMAEFFAKAGHEVTWFTSAFDHYNREHRCEESRPLEASPGYTIHYLKAPGYRRNASLARLRDERAVAREFARQARSLPAPDLIICSLPSVAMAAVAAEIAHSANARLVCDVRDLWPDVFLDFLPRRARPFAAPFVRPMRRQLRKVIEASDVVTGLTDEYIEWAHQGTDRQIGSQDTPLLMAYMPTTAMRLEEGEIREMQKKFGVSENTLNVLFVGTIGPMMNFEPVIDAARLLDQEKAPINIRLCGAGSGLEQIKRKASDLKNVSFPGWINAREISYLLEQSDVGLLPYQDLNTFRWSIPNKFGEYLAGSLVLAGNLSNSAMARVIRSSGAGFVYDDNPEALAEALARLQRDASELRRFRKRADNLYADQFHGPDVFTGFVEKMERLVSRAAKTGNEKELCKQRSNTSPR